MQNAPVNVVVVVVLAVLGGFVLLAALLVGILWLLRHFARQSAEEVRAQHPDAELGPEPCQYRGGTGTFPRVRNTGWLVLTPTALVVRTLTGVETRLPVADITGARMESSFNTHRNGRPVLVLETARGEVGLTVREPERWRAALLR